MKQILIITISIFFAYSASAQFSLYFNAGGVMQSWRSTEFEMFKASYNDYFKNNISKPFNEEKEPMAFGTYLNAGFGIGDVFLMESGRYHVSSSQDVVFSNNEIRRFHIGFSDWTTLFLIGPGSEKGFIAFAPGLLIRVGTLSSSYIYRDGTESMGDERNLNGQYRSFRLYGTLGVKGGVRIVGPLMAEASVQWLPGAVKRKSTNDLGIGYSRNMGGDINYYTEFPLSVKEYNTTTTYSYEQMRDDSRSWRFTLGLRININPED